MYTLLPHPGWQHEPGRENTTITPIPGDLCWFTFDGDPGWVPGNVFGEVVEGLAEMAAACQDLWMGGVRGERLTLRREED
ncbi:DUF3830 family protein [Serinicoccus sp. CNJ-927]|uniref:DUF3830 family protein n=1 Tax=Serinicoccus sp. CNJ-927 TaxID=1904970 RepID=UPI002AA2AEEF|nr:DUF3830 family protein [Serinicoccus sp. CNJ-927]